MSAFITRQDEDTTSPSSDEKMDTSDSFRSQDTTISDDDHECDHGDLRPLRLQNPNDSIVTKMSNLNIMSPEAFNGSDLPDLNGLSLSGLDRSNLPDVNESDASELYGSPVTMPDKLDYKMPNLNSTNKMPNLNLLDSPNTTSTESKMPDTEKNAQKNVSEKNLSQTGSANKLPNTEYESEKPSTDCQKMPDNENCPKNANLQNSPKMSSLNVDSQKTTGISPPKFVSTLTLTTNHPLMQLSSPEDYPDLIPKKHQNEKDVSISSTEDEKLGFYIPERNTSKNNLYFSDNFVTAESFMLHDTSDLPPDVARVEKMERRWVTAKMETPQRLGLYADWNKDRFAMAAQSTPKHDDIDITREEYHSGVAEWCESPSHQRTVPNFDLPIELSTGIAGQNDLDSPDVLSTSTQDEKSAYQALLDPYTGSVALKHKARTQAPVAYTKRKIVVPDDDAISVDSVTGSSLDSEEEPGEIQEREDREEEDPDDETNKSISTNTVSYSSEPIPEYSAAEELNNERAWLTVPTGSHHNTCDMKVIEPYKRVLSHGGYSSTGAALIVFSACHLPDNGRNDYTYVMDNLFLYVIWTLERLVTEEYELVYLHGSASRRRLPTFHWLHECYKLIDRRLRKSLKHLYLVHPTFWLKSFVLLTKPFVSSKFFKKLSYVKNLDELLEKVPLEPNAIPELVKQYDVTRRR